ncbi:putative ribonuclease H-like domain-containing protein [Tanacetum coccineum]|uniref:Ribonuclease H-like domain-containing protein n=1 Tax=Tanacetum coccineum TaxID=301880 RepID=A0ABQ5IMC6_9ASTR
MAQEKGTSVTKMSVPVTAEEKTNKKNDVKARSLLLMALPNEHQLTLSQYTDAKTMFAAIKIRFGAFMTAPSTSRTYDVNTAIPVYGVSTASPNVNTASPQVSTASFSDNAVYAFMVENPNGSNLLHQDLEKIHEDDLEAMDLKWQLSLLSTRAKRAPRNKEGQFRNQGNTRKQGNNEDTSSKAMLAINGVGFDWSDMAEEHVQTNMALMAFSDSELNQTKFTAATYKRGLAIVEEQLITYRKNEVLFSKEVAVLKREVACKYYEINVLKSEFEKVKQEKEGIEFKIEKFDKASKDLDKLLGSQITDKSKKGLGYSAVPLPHPLIYNRPKKLNLSYSSLDEFKEPEFKGYDSENSKQESNIVCDKKSNDSKENSADSLVKEQVSKDTSSFVESTLNVDKETVFPVDKKVESVKPKNHEKPVKKSVRVNYNYTTKRTRPNAQRNMVPRAVLIWPKPFNTARTVNTAHPKFIVFSAKPMSCFPKIAQSTVRRPFQSKTTLSNKRFTHKVNTAKAQAVNTARPQAVNTGRPKAVKTARPNSTVVNVVRVNQANGKPQQDDTGFVDSGCSRHMTGNIAYLSDFKEFDGGYVTFGGGAHGGRISGKGTLKTNSLDFENVYFVNDLKLNLFSVSQMSDKKNYVLFTDTEYIVLSPNFKLPDENQIHLKIPRKYNMYSFDMKNIVPKESLTCLVANATLDESMLWHRRLDHINFKNINTHVKDNLAEIVSTACYVQNWVLVAKPHNKILYELFRGFKPVLSFRKPFGCHVTILNTLNSLGNFDGKSDEDFFVEYYLSSKDFKVHKENLMQDVDNGEPKSTADDQNPDVNTGSFKLNTVDPSVNTASSYDQDNHKDMFTMGASHTLEATHCEFFSDEDEPEIRRMTKPTSEQGFLSGSNAGRTFTIQTPTSLDTYGFSYWYETLANYLLGNGFKRGKIDQTLFIKKQKGDILLVQVYVDDIIFGSTNKELCTGFEKLMKDKFQMSSMGELTFFLGLQVQQKEDGIFISQDKYVAEILKKFNYTDVKSASTPVDLEKPLVKDGDADDVDVHLYRSMIGSLMYLTASRPDIMFAVCACARFQVTPKTSHLLAVKRIFRYLKGKPTLGLWYSRDSPFELVAYTDSDYAGATQDRKSTTGGCQFLGNRLISWQCKKQTMVATSTTEAEYVAAASCCGQVLWIQNQLLDYGYNFMHTVINIDNNSTICIIENPVQHSKTKHIEIRHHFIRDCNAKKLIQMVKIHTDHNVADLLTKGFDAGRFQYLVSSH